MPGGGARHPPALGALPCPTAAPAGVAPGRGGQGLPLRRAYRRGHPPRDRRPPLHGKSSARRSGMRQQAPKWYQLTPSIPPQGQARPGEGVPVPLTVLPEGGGHRPAAATPRSRQPSAPGRVGSGVTGDPFPRPPRRQKGADRRLERIAGPTADPAPRSAVEVTLTPTGGDRCRVPAPPTCASGRSRPTRPARAASPRSRGSTGSASGRSPPGCGPPARRAAARPGRPAAAGRRSAARPRRWPPWWRSGTTRRSPSTPTGWPSARACGAAPRPCAGR